MRGSHEKPGMAQGQTSNLMIDLCVAFFLVLLFFFERTLCFRPFGHTVSSICLCSHQSEHTLREQRMYFYILAKFISKLHLRLSRQCLSAEIWHVPGSLQEGCDSCNPYLFAEAGGYTPYREVAGGFLGLRHHLFGIDHVTRLERRAVGDGHDVALLRRAEAGHRRVAVSHPVGQGHGDRQGRRAGDQKQPAARERELLQSGHHALHVVVVGLRVSSEPNGEKGCFFATNIDSSGIDEEGFHGFGCDTTSDSYFSISRIMYVYIISGLHFGSLFEISSKFLQ